MPALRSCFALLLLLFAATLAAPAAADEPGASPLLTPEIAFDTPAVPADDLADRVNLLEQELSALRNQPVAAPTAATSPQPTYPTVAVTGFFQLDAAWFEQDADSITALGDIPDIAGFRRARLAAKGQVAENVGYMVEFDFGFPGRPSFMDVYLELQDLPVGTMRVGQWRQPFGMDSTTSVRELWFLERALPFVVVPFRQTGVGVFNTACDDSVTWAASGYRYFTDLFGNDFGDSGYGGATRVTVNPLYDEDLRAVAHFGFSYSVNDPSASTLRFRQTPEVGFTRGDFNTAALALPFFLDTGPIPTELYNLVGLELGAALGPFALQAEVHDALIEQQAGPFLQFPGTYVQATWVLTGEHHPYNRKQGVFTRIVPDHPFGKAGCGAWELAARWSMLDLNDENIDGGRLYDSTLGLNWYLNKFTKFQLNYIHANLDTDAVHHAVTDVVAIRGQLDF